MSVPTSIGAEDSSQGKIQSVKQVVNYRPTFTLFIVLFSSATALLEGIGLTFLFPIIEVTRSGGASIESAGGIVGVFLAVYDFLGLPFNLEFIILGVSSVMVVRYTSSFLVLWFSVKLQKEYERDLKIRAVDAALRAKISYYDQEGSDSILNAIVTQTRYAGKVIKNMVDFFQSGILILMYVTVAVLISPWLMLFAAAVAGILTYVIRGIIEPGYTVGERVAEANERLQTSVQAGTQGIREIKLFGMIDRIYAEFLDAVSQYTQSSIVANRNRIAINKFYELTVALVLFLVIYAALEFFSLTIAGLGVFLFAMFRLAPRVSQFNSMFYTIESDFPHLVRTHQFISKLDSYEEDDEPTKPVPDDINSIIFDDVSFSYETSGETVLKGISFEVHQNDFVGFVGKSGAGKSSIVSLLSRLYQPDDGRILANGTPITEFGLEEWRGKVAMVQQNPHIFNDTLRYNLAISNPDVPEEEIYRVADIAKVTEFLDQLPDGMESELGEDGVQLSGGQRQRIALARALLAEAEILVLDEATSDLDSDLEQQIHEAIESLGEEYTIIAIAHRLSTVMNADRIYTVERGEITEEGTHEELIENNGKYAELYAIQS